MSNSLTGSTWSSEFRRTKIYKSPHIFFVVVGASIGFSATIDFSDTAIFAMSIFSIIGLYYLMPVVKRELASFLARINSGEIKKFK